MATATTPKGTLITHCGARKVERAELRLLPAPAPLGARHRPIPHADLVEAVHGEAAARGLGVAREEYAIQREGALLFGVMDLAGEGVQAHALAGPGCGAALGLRSSTDESFAIALTAGAQRVLICDNLALVGDVLALHRKHTSGLDLSRALGEAFDRFLEQSRRFAAELARLREAVLSDSAAREVIYAATASEVMPLRLFPAVHRNYFEVDAEARPDCAERTRWGLHNSFTRAFKELAPARAWTANLALGRLFGLRAA